MYRYKDVELRKFTLEDIPNKVRWINDSNNNQFLHYDLPLTIEKTTKWYECIKEHDNRWDATAFYHGEPVGLFGLLNIDYKNKQAEDYSLIGELPIKKKGIGAKAGILNVAYAFYDLKLEKVWGIIEVGNEASLKRWRGMGGIVEGYLHNHFCKGNYFTDAYYVAIFKNSFILPSEVYEER